MSQEKYWGQINLKKSLYYIFSRTSIELFSAFSRKIFDEVVKTAFNVSIATFWKIKLKFSDVGQKTIGILWQTIRQGCQNCFPGVHGNKLSRKTFRWKPYIFLFRHWAENFTFVRKFFEWVVRTAFHLAIGLFWEEVSSLSFFSIFFGPWARNLRDFVECLSTGLSKLHSSRPEAFFALNIFCKKFVEFCLSLSPFQTKKSCFMAEK